MATNRTITLGLLSPATPNKPHFKHVDALLPPGVSLIHEGLGLLGDAYQDLAGKADVVIAKAKDFVARNKVDGLVLTGGFIGLFNPGIDVKVSEAIQLPVATAVSSASRGAEYLQSQICAADDALRRQVGCSDQRSLE